MPTDRDLFAQERAMVVMSFGDHIEELRRRLILALLGLFAGVVVALAPPADIGRWVVRLMQAPARRMLEEFEARDARERIAAAEALGAYSPTPARIPAGAFARAVGAAFPAWKVGSDDATAGGYVELPLELKGSGLIVAVSRAAGGDDSLVALGPMEPAIIFFRVCLAAGLVMASPWVFYQLWAFLAAGLYRHERATVYAYLPFSLGLFLAGVFLCFFSVLPLTLRFLLEFNAWLGVKPMLRLSEWMGFATVLPLVFGLCFQTPLAMRLLSAIGIFTAEDYRANRRIAFLIIVVVAAVLTPGPDFSSMLLLSLPMALLYELGVLLAREPAAAC